jgi:hypothetical protein
MGSYCPDGETCPRLFELGDGNVVVQGYVVPDDEVPDAAAPPPGERLMRLPRGRLVEFGRELEQRSAPRPGHLLDSVRSSAFRLEAQPIYDVGDERWELYRQGKPLPPRTPETSAWLRRVADTTRAGVRWSRVHVVDGLTDYLTFELAEYLDNARAGEEVRIADAGRHPELRGLSGEDFWLCDDGGEGAFAQLMRYSATGKYLGAWRADDSAALAECRRQREVAWAASEPLRDYLARVDLDTRRASA